MAQMNSKTKAPAYDKKTALVLQGGGALGSYQAGVYEAMDGTDYQPDWVAGISIGAINAAIIAGNEPKDRVARLRDFWNTITAPTAFWPAAPSGPLRVLQKSLGANMALMFGQPGFFKPLSLSDWLAPEKPSSYYSTDALKQTLLDLVDFERINHPDEMRLSVGAVNVQTGRFAYFDNRDITIRPEHIMASGALPPGFPPVEIDGQYYWDGGLVSNTPLQYVLDYYPRRSRLTFQVDVFQAFGPLPQDLNMVSEREKDIRYSSRTRVNTDAFAQKHDVRHAINELHKLLPKELADSPEAKRLYAHGCVTEMDIVQIIYRPTEPQGASKDHDFSRTTMDRRWQQGLSDARLTMEAQPWLAPNHENKGVRLFDVIHDRLMAEMKKKQSAPLKAS
ncbi:MULTISPECIES: patatin-like phospholipase family protein [unclassified Iodidimonas]|jgi:NTE family protein|uniref:patatin-like phospholipase family protein n=1 Tax=unclassified Iodidimonas TaxID=2626145 RepID=UPI0024824A4A|nr:MULTISPECIES: patatin-like phospholipase family protein [unclassified Iodidimonas]